MRIELPQDAEPQFAMAPMIDMVFLLLVFFMCASHLSQRRNIPLDVPTASKAVVPRDRPDRWIVNVDAAGTLYSGSDPVTLETLKRRVSAELELRPALRIYVRADAGAEHRHVKKVMNALAETGVDEFIFGVYKPTVTGGAAP